MFSFYTTVTIIAIVLLVMALTIIGISIKKNSRTNTFPDYQYSCPDFWTLSDDNKTCMAPPGINNPTIATLKPKKPENEQLFPNMNSIRPDPDSPAIKELKTKGLILNADNTIKSIDITTDTWPAMCSKVAWAKTNNILWDGIGQSNACV
jgi:hypothetical protein